MAVDRTALGLAAQLDAARVETVDLELSRGDGHDLAGEKAAVARGDGAGEAARGEARRPPRGK